MSTQSHVETFSSPTYGGMEAGVKWEHVEFFETKFLQGAQVFLRALFIWTNGAMSAGEGQSHWEEMELL